MCTHTTIKYTACGHSTSLIENFCRSHKSAPVSAQCDGISFKTVDRDGEVCAACQLARFRAEEEKGEEEEVESSEAKRRRLRKESGEN